jgi:S-adenosylmethionine:tRNA ribosyltransferase-isomerase
LILKECQAFCSSPIKEVYLRIQDFNYELPADRVATYPMADRDAAKLLTLDIPTNARRHASFRNISGLLRPSSLVVLNDTRVIPARLVGKKPTGGRAELLLVRRIDDENTSHLNHSAESWEEMWEVLLRGVGPGPAASITFEDGARADVVEMRERGSGKARIHGTGADGVLGLCERLGVVPLPPYIESARKQADRNQEGPGTTGPADQSWAGDRLRYQTVYARAPGAVAAPTAGLHFTEPLLAELQAAGHEIARLTLHVGPGTFRPVTADDPRDHQLDPEAYEVPEATAAAVRRAQAEGRPVVAVGTTVVRTLETVARSGDMRAGSGWTDLYLLPGTPFRVVTDLITNFHLPRSTLLMLVAAFAGREKVLEAYDEAISAGYRFYSYGDAMLLLRGGAFA